jgi:O-antigen/teichoic acid export membrane protein
VNIKNILNHKVVKASGWYTLTNFFLKGLAFLTIPIFTRLLTTGDYGTVALYTSWVGIFTIVMTLDLKVSVGRGFYDFKEEYNQFVSSVIFLSLLVFCSFLGLFIIFNDFFLNITGLTKILFYIMIFQAYFAFVNEYAIYKFKFEYKYKLVSILTITTTIAGILLSIFLVVNVFETQRYLGKIIGGASIAITAGIFWFIYLIIKGKKLVDFKYWKYALFLSVPLIMHNVSGIVNNQFDRIIINKYLGDSPTGIYSFAYNVGMIVTVLLASLNQAWVPWFYEQMDKKNYANIKKKADTYRDFFVLAYALLLFISPELVRIMADERYWEGLYIVPWIFMAYYFQYMYTLEVNVEFFHKRTGLISLGTILSAAINVVLNIILIPIYGYPAAAVTTAISYLFLFIFHYILTSKVIKHSVWGIRFHLKSLIYLVFITLAFIMLQDLILLRILLFMVMLMAFYYVAKSRKIN